MNFDSQLIEQIPRLRRYARALTRDAVRADDLVQDTLERAWTKRALWRRGSNLRAWLFTIMHNVYVNQVKAQDKVTEVDLESTVLTAKTPTAEQTTAIRDVQEGLERLPLEMREVLLLVCLEQFTYAETAKLLGIPTGTVMSRLSRGRERLRQWIEGRPDNVGLKVVQ
jgi:RNA polymerase sigma-70 factor (ECF subfamily)